VVGLQGRARGDRYAAAGSQKPEFMRHGVLDGVLDI
jgi:hypothetical protein